jgi:GR25 family glycosyltransferase involved in LPS biosynthesis
MGLANSIVTGITKLCQSFGRVIVLEDDLLLSSNFLRYMNAALEKYKHVEQVMQISGYMFPVKLNFSTDAIFLPFITSWGWATWQRAWKHFDPQMSEYSRLKTDRALRYKFDLNSSYPYFKMLEAQIKGKVDSWAIRWYLSTFMQEGLTLYPVHSLVKNIGFDGSGTNCNAASHFDLELSEEEVIYLPELVIENASATDAISKYLYALQSPRELILAKILSIIDKIKNIFARG